jgi:GntR family transcriptional regulator
MFFQIEPSDPTPIYEQVMRRVKFAIAKGLLTPGELVPSVREMAKQAAINPNTVARAYGKLQDEGVLELRRGTGLAVTEAAPDLCRRDRIDLIRGRLRGVLDEASQSGLDETHVEELVTEELNTSKTRRQDS